MPDFAAATTLADEAGTGAANWSPTRAGAYYLTHATMNSETNAQLLSAWFEVAGPSLSLVPQGELTNGVMVAIAGDEDGWTIRYTTDGSTPTAASPAYDGAFSLPSSATVRAVAYSASGVASEEVCETFTLHDALSLVSAVARQRYPWNGKVDVDCELKGDPAQKYLVSLTAKDLDGGAALPLKTAWAVGGDVTNSVFSLAPGRYRFVWDADADIASDGDFPRVAVSVTAEGGPLVGYSRRMAISVDGYAGSETLTNVPVLVRLSTAIAGFDYDDFASPSNGADLAFFDADERSLAYEIDEWNTNGESLVWVKLPELTRGARFTAAWGATSASIYGRGTGRGSAAGQSVWRDYAGVWHMNEASGVAYDSTANGLDALPDCGSNGTAATLAQMVAYENGACGKARVNSLKLDGRGNDKQNFMLVPSYDALGLGSSFVIAGWFKGEYWNDGTSWYPRLVSRKSVSNTDDGWEVCLRDAYVTISDETNFVVDYDIPDVSQEWVQIVVVYESDRCICFTNGVSCGEKSLSGAVSDNGGQLAFGNTATGSRWSFIGQYDEIRLLGGTLSADRIKADYDMVADRGFLGYGEVTKGAEAAE